MQKPLKSLDSHIDAHANAHLSVVMLLIKLAAITNLDRQATLNYLMHRIYCALFTLSPISLCLLLPFNQPAHSLVMMVHKY